MRGFSPLAPQFSPPMTFIVTTSESCHRENSKNQKLIVTKRIILLVNTLCVRTFSTRYNCVTTLYTTWKIMCILWY